MCSYSLKVRSKRLHMIFPVSGPEARGVVSIEAKKKRGRHKFKLLAVDMVRNDGHEERIFLEGSDSLCVCSPLSTLSLPPSLPLVFGE